MAAALLDSSCATSSARDEQGALAGTPPCDQTAELQWGATEHATLRTAAAAAVLDVGDGGIRTVDKCLPGIAAVVGPGCCFVRSHPNCVCVPFDLFTERVYHRPLAVVTFAAFTWRAFLAYFVALAGTDPTSFSLCGRDYSDVTRFLQNREDNRLLFLVLGTAQSGALGVVFATLIGLGNSRYEKRCWGWISPIVATFSFLASWPALQLCSLELSDQGDDGNFALYAGAASNFVSACLYSVQLLLSLLLLARRRASCYGSGDGVCINTCGPMEFSEPLPIRPLAPRSPHAEDTLSTGLLADPSERDRAEHREQLAAESGALSQQEGHRRAQIPLRFWIAVTLSTTVVVYLAAMGAVYGTFLTDRLRVWAQNSNNSIIEAKAFLEALPGQDPPVLYMISLLGGVSSAIDIIVANFFAVRVSATIFVCSCDSVLRVLPGVSDRST